MKMFLQISKRHNILLYQKLKEYIESWRKIKDFLNPLIVAVNGYELGDGCESTIVGQPEILLGLIIPGAGGTQ